MGKTKECDLLIVGGGPAGLSAAINGASEGLRVMLLDTGPVLGGQALNSSMIENFPGFPDGISGADLLQRFVRQSVKFKTDIVCPVGAISLRADGARRIIQTEDDETIATRAVILANGLSYRRLAATGIGPLMGRGVLYGAPTTDPNQLGECHICIVGGANSAGQAAMHLSQNPAAHVTLLVRRTIRDQMSQYLIDRIAAAKNITVREGVEVDAVVGEKQLEQVILRHVGSETKETLPAAHLFIFIGAMPKIMWLNGSVHMDSKKFIVTGPKLVEMGKWGAESNRTPFIFETSMPGVFAAGDVRLGSTKRIASAVGEGVAALAMVHAYLDL